MMIKPVLLCAALLAAAVAGFSVEETNEEPDVAERKMHGMGPMGMSMSMGMMGMGYAPDACATLNLVEPAASRSPGGSDIKMLLDKAFPNTTVGGPWNPVYYTKKYNGMHPSYGGYPTPLDTRYPFEAAAPFLGQPGAGSPHHCPETSPTSLPVQSCPKLVLEQDHTYAFWEGDHIPPHISLVAVNNAIARGCGILDELFDYAKYGCNFVPDTLIMLIRKMYPRPYMGGTRGAVSYPPPVDPNTKEYFPLEFPGNAGPHWCSQAVLDDGMWGDYCPYMPEGKYRHPHLALSAVETYLANVMMPDLCADDWWSNHPGYPYDPDTSIAFPVMEDENDLNSQPAVPHQWPGPDGRKMKAVNAAFTTHLVVAEPDLTVHDPYSDGPAYDPDAGVY